MAKATKRNASPKKQLRQKSLDIHYKVTSDDHILYADQYTIQFFADEFIVSFFQSEHPLIFSGEEFDKQNTVEAKCVARFVLNPNQMHRFVVAVNENLRKWREIHVPKEASEK